MFKVHHFISRWVLDNIHRRLSSPPYRTGDMHSSQSRPVTHYETHEHRPDPPASKAQIKRASKTEMQKQEMTLFLRRRVFGDGLCALRHGVLSKFTGQDEADTVKETM